MKDFIYYTTRFIMIVITSVLSMTLIILIFLIIISVIAAMTALNSIDYVTSVKMPEKERENSSYIYDIDGDTGEYNLIYKVSPCTGDVKIDINIDNIPYHVREAFICIEDERFYSHEGFDLKTTSVAFVKEMLSMGGLISENSSGGSTITQQLVKNITQDDEITFDRKYREIIRAVNLEEKYTKDEILEQYLNIIYFGQDKDGINMYGIEAAALGYFGKHADELSDAEAAVLAAIPQNPYSKNPLVNYEENEERKCYCLRKMFEQGILSPSEYERAINQKIKLIDKDDDRSLINYTVDFENPEPTTWVIDTALSEFCEYLSEAENITTSEAMERFKNGGFELYLTARENIQGYIENRYLDTSIFPSDFSYSTDDNGEEHYETVQSAFVVMDYKGKILGIVGRIGEKTESFGWNNAVNAHRQPGSTIKPLATYGYAIENNIINWSSIVEDKPLEAGIAEENEWPSNYTGTYSEKNLFAYRMFASSLNTLPAQLCYTCGLENIFKFSTEQMHLPLNKKTDITYATLALGATGTGPNLCELAASYVPYGNGGTYYTPHIISRIKDSSTERVYLDRDSIDGKQAVSEDTAYIINRLMRRVITDGTGTGALLEHKNLVGKTGTTENFRDILFVGLTPDFVSAIWIGYENGENQYAIRSANSAKIWKQVFGEFADNFNLSSKFPVSSGVECLRYCAETGLIAHKNCPYGGYGYYKKDSYKICNVTHKKKEEATETEKSADLTN